LSGDPHADVVARQYERWMYPAPIHDLQSWLANHWEWFDPSHSHRMLWPGGGYDPALSILVAGCGTNQAAVFAFTNPDATVVGVDVSQASLDHHEWLKDTYGLGNLELHLLAVEEVETLGRDFDLIVSTGVLHHLADPQRGANALASCLRPSGVLAVMLYARYGRIGVELLESVFQDLGLQQDDPSIAMVTEALASVPRDHPVRSYLAIAPDLNYDAGLVDTFLHGRQRSYTVDDCLDLTHTAGLAFQDWFLKSPYEPTKLQGGAFSTAIAALPDHKRWSVMERLNTRNAAHFFTSVRAERPLSDYRVDFTGPDVWDYVPEFRHRCRLEAGELVRPGRRLLLDEDQHLVATRIDGHRSLRLISADLAPATADTTVPDDMVAGVVQSLWMKDFLAIRLPTGR
jgi:SAM-dependent methyltransferase